MINKIFFIEGSFQTICTMVGAKLLNIKENSKMGKKMDGESGVILAIISIMKDSSKMISLMVLEI